MPPIRQAIQRKSILWSSQAANMPRLLLIFFFERNSVSSGYCPVAHWWKTTEMACSIMQALIALLCCAWLLRLLFNYFTPGLTGMPGPYLARFSDLSRFLDACSGHHHETISKLHQQYGHIVRIGPSAVSVSDPAAVENVLSLKANLDKTDSVKPMINTYEGEYMPMLISAMDSEVHARIQKPVAGAYSMTSTLTFERILDQTIDQFLSQLRKFGPNQSCPIGNWMEYFAFDFILQVNFSQNWGFMEAGKDLDGMLRLLDLQFLYISTMGAMPWLDHLLLKNPLLLMLVKTPNPLVDFASAQLKARLQSLEKMPEVKTDFLDHFILAQKANPEVVSDLQLTTYTATNVLAASDTTSATLTTILYHILRHPEAHAKVKAEVNGANLSLPVTYAKASNLQYLDAAIHEAMRICPTTGIELERKVGPSGLILPSGERLPAGAGVGINAWAVHFNKEVFGDDAQSFRPERWLRNNKESQGDFDDRLRRMRRAFLTFGSGPRACLGKALAMMQVYKVIATLFQTFHASKNHILGQLNVLTWILQMTLCDPDKPMRTRSTITVKILDVEIYLSERQ